jgi:hypothetical protein
MSLWRCPACGDEQEALAIEVAHRCPKRVVQAAPAKGKRKLPEMVNYICLSPKQDETLAAAKSRIVRNETKRQARQYLTMTIKAAG